MASAGPNYCDSGTNLAGGGTYDWTNPGNITAAGDIYATATGTSGALSNYLKAVDFDFAIPSATINGIVVTIERKANQEGSLRYIKDNTLKLVKGDVISGDNKGDTATKWPLVEGAVDYGSSTELWGLSFNPSDINAIDFGAVLSINAYGAAGATGSVDYITITVYYTEGGGSPTSQTRKLLLGVGK